MTYSVHKCGRTGGGHLGGHFGGHQTKLILDLGHK